MGCHFLFQWIFLTQRWNSGLSHCRWILYHLSHQGSPWKYHPNISCSVTLFCSCPQSLPASRSFPVSWLFASRSQNIGASASASVFPMNIQGSFTLGLTGLISLLSKGLSRVFSSTTVRRHQFFFDVNLFYCLALTSIHDYWKNHSFD